MLKKLKKAFTITELVIVIAVIAILAAVLIPTFSNVVENAHKSSALQTSKNALTDYLAIVGTDDEPDNDNPSGIVFVNEGYVHVYLNSALHYVGELDDLGYIASSGTVDIDKTKKIDKITFTGITDETSLSPSAASYLQIDPKDETINNIEIYFQDQTTPAAATGLAPEDEETVVEGVAKKAESVYFYSVEVNETTYYGFFTLEAVKDAKYQIESCVYSRLSGVTKQGFTVSFTAGE